MSDMLEHNKVHMFIEDKRRYKDRRASSFIAVRYYYCRYLRTSQQQTTIVVNWCFRKNFTEQFHAWKYWGQLVNVKLHRKLLLLTTSINMTMNHLEKAQQAQTYWMIPNRFSQAKCSDKTLKFPALRFSVKFIFPRLLYTVW